MYHVDYPLIHPLFRDVLSTYQIHENMPGFEAAKRQCLECLSCYALREKFTHYVCVLFFLQPELICSHLHGTDIPDICSHCPF